jgi:hypothetical protein
MNNLKSFNVTYDRDGDVLYLSVRRDRAARGVEDRNGIVWRYNSSGDLLGATIVDFAYLWNGNRGQIAKAIAKKFEIPTAKAEVVLDHAIQ